MKSSRGFTGFGPFPSGVDAVARVGLQLLIGLVLGAVLSVPFSPCAEAASSPSQGLAIGIVRVPGDERLMRRVRAELLALGFRVVEVPSSARPNTSSRPLEVEERSLSAALRLDPAAHAVELWIFKQDAGEIPHRELIDLSDLGADDLRSLRTVEVLRARLLRLAPPGTPPPLDQGPTPSLPQSKEPHRWFWLSAAPALGFSPGGLGETPFLQLSTYVKPRQPWSISLFTLMPLSARELVQNEGSVEVRALLAAAAFDVFLLDGTWKYSLGAAGGASWLFVESRASAPYTGHNSTNITSTWFVRMALSRRLGRWLDLKAGLMFGVATPSAVISVAERDVATWGRPFGLASLGIDYAPYID